MKQTNDGIVRIDPRAARVNARLTRDEACKLIGIGKYSLISIETGRTSPTVPIGYKMSEVYGIPFDNISFCRKISL